MNEIRYSTRPCSPRAITELQMAWLREQEAEIRERLAALRAADEEASA